MSKDCSYCFFCDTCTECMPCDYYHPIDPDAEAETEREKEKEERAKFQKCYDEYMCDRE